MDLTGMLVDELRGRIRTEVGSIVDGSGNTLYDFLETQLRANPWMVEQLAGAATETRMKFYEDAEVDWLKPVLMQDPAGTMVDPVTFEELVQYVHGPKGKSRTTRERLEEVAEKARIEKRMADFDARRSAATAEAIRADAAERGVPTHAIGGEEEFAESPEDIAEEAASRARIEKGSKRSDIELETFAKSETDIKAELQRLLDASKAAKGPVGPDLTTSEAFADSASGVWDPSRGTRGARSKRAGRSR